VQINWFKIFELKLFINFKNFEHGVHGKCKEFNGEIEARGVKGDII
jgi:hypothetical protein